MFSPYTFHYVCLPCRRAVKSQLRAIHIPCPVCHGEMLNFGKRFAAPRKKDDAQWKKLGWMIQNGWRGYGWATRPRWPIQPKMNLREVQELFATSAQAEKAAGKAKEDAALLERCRAAKNPHIKLNKKRLKAELKRQEKYQTAVLESVAAQNRVSA